MSRPKLLTSYVNRRKRECLLLKRVQEKDRYWAVYCPNNDYLKEKLGVNFKIAAPLFVI